MNICHIFTLTVDVENPYGEFEDVHQQIFFAKSHENPTLPGRVDLNCLSLLTSCVQTLINSPDRVSFHETLQVEFAGKYRQIHTRDF